MLYLLHSPVVIWRELECCSWIIVNWLFPGCFKTQGPTFNLCDNLNTLQTQRFRIMLIINGTYMWIMRPFLRICCLVKEFLNESDSWCLFIPYYLCITPLDYTGVLVALKFLKILIFSFALLKSPTVIYTISITAVMCGNTSTRTCTKTPKTSKASSYSNNLLLLWPWINWLISRTKVPVVNVYLEGRRSSSLAFTLLKVMNVPPALYLWSMFTNTSSVHSYRG